MLSIERLFTCKKIYKLRRAQTFVGGLFIIRCLINLKCLLMVVMGQGKQEQRRIKSGVCGDYGELEATPRSGAE